VFNLGEEPEPADVAWSDIGIRGSAADVRDLWTHKALASQQNLHIELRPHASALYRLTLSQ
jgi:alpha-galactosidase